MTEIVIIHGWSDFSKSFRALKRALKAKLNIPVNDIALGEYITLDDDIRMSDLVFSFNEAWDRKKYSREPFSVDVVIHSTGALIVRDWVHQYFTSLKNQSPIRNFVMLAPANFGSPLAHKGKAIHGRIFKGGKSDKFFETGKQILDALEIASPYTHELALRDRFTNTTPYSVSKTRVTTIVGNKGYGGLKGLANSPGSDGTVYVATANMNAAKLNVAFDGSENPNVSTLQTSNGKTAFLVLDDFNHGSITHRGKKSNDGDHITAIIEALSVDSRAEFNSWINDCDNATRILNSEYCGDFRKHKHGFQNTVFYVVDDEGYPVNDYVVEFYSDFSLGEDDEFSERFNNDIVTKTHVNKSFPNYRSFLVDCDKLSTLSADINVDLKISISAYPDFNDKKNHVGYKTFEDDDIGEWTVKREDFDEYFVRNRTMYIEIRLSRLRKESTFKIIPSSP